MNRKESQQLARLRRRDERAFREFVREHQERVYRLCQQILTNSAEAEDVAQEVFVTVFKSIDRFRGDSKLSTWVHRIAVNHCKNRIRYLARRKQQKQEQAQEEHLTDSTASSPDERVIRRQGESELVRLLRRLPEDFRIVVVLRDVQGFSYEEICHVTGLPEGTIKSRLHRGRGTLRTMLEETDKKEEETNE